MVALIIALVRDLLDLGLPPGINDSDELRAWLGKLAEFLDQLTELSETSLDDKAVALLQTCTECDECWEAVYSLITHFAGEDELAVMASAPMLDTIEDKTEIDPVTIIAIIKLVVELIQLWRERKQ